MLEEIYSTNDHTRIEFLRGLPIMSAAAAVKVPSGFARFPRSVITNIWAFTPAEIALLLMVENNTTRRSISDRHWVEWTGLAPRSKEVAVKGLRDKGLTVEGRGDKAHYFFEAKKWEAYVRTVDRAAIQTKPSKAVSPRPGAKIHEQCRDRGCAMMFDELPTEVPTDSGLSLLPATQNAQKTAQTTPSGCSLRPKTLPPSNSGLTQVTATQNAQKTARSVGSLGQVWPLSLERLQGLFITADEVFLTKLLDVVRSSFRGVTDGELVVAINSAWLAKKSIQKGEGLFLRTVPAALAVKRREPAPLAAPGLFEQANGAMGRLSGNLRARGGEYVKHAESVEFVGTAMGVGGDLLQAEEQLGQIQAAVVETCRAELSPHNRDVVRQRVAEMSSRHGRHMTAAQALTFERQTEDREILNVCEIPRFTLFDA